MSVIEQDTALTGVIGEIRSEIAGLREEVSELLSPRVEILSEPLTYDARLVRDSRGPAGLRAVSNGDPRSYIRDFVLAQTRGDTLARERLARHAQEMRALGEGREQLFAPGVSVEFERRAVNWGAGTGGYFAPPAWIVEQFAIVPTPQRVLSRLAPQFELPLGAQSVSLPRWSAGAEADTSQLDAAGVSTDIADAIVSSAVATIAGTEDVPMQMLEQSPAGAHLDWAVFTNMEARYGYQLEAQLINGTGVSGADATRSGNNQLLGILNNAGIPSANVINYTGAGEGQTTGAAAMFPSIGLAMAKVGINRQAPPECWLMSTARVAWLGSSEDTATRPLMIANSDGSGKFDLIAINVEFDDAIPRNVSGTAIPLGSGGTQEPIICCRPSDWLILESERHTQVMLDVLSGTLMARLQCRRYAAALLRQPTSVAVLVGSGMQTGGGF